MFKKTLGFAPIFEAWWYIYTPARCLTLNKSVMSWAASTLALLEERQETIEEKPDRVFAYGKNMEASQKVGQH